MKSDGFYDASENKREFYRVRLTKPLKLTVSIYMIQGKVIDKIVGSFPIVNISAGGLAFLSPLKLSVNPGITYQFRFFINGKEKKLEGVIVRDVDDCSMNLYGAKFTIMPTEKTELLADIHQLATYVKRGGHNPDKYHHF